VKRLTLERLEPRDEFRFSLRGVLDAAGARALDRLLLQCQARDAREVHLELSGVSEVSTLGLSVLERQARVYEGTDRRIVVHGVGGGVREALVASGAVLYAANGSADGLRIHRSSRHRLRRRPRRPQRPRPPPWLPARRRRWPSTRRFT
jgi:anti-anti-sigma regulatory factor